MSNINQILSRIVQMQSQIVSRLNKMPAIGSTGSGSDLVEINQNIEDLEIRVQNIINANSTLSTAISVLDQKISKQLSDSIIPLNIKQISGSVVELSNEYNCYKLTPTTTLNLQFDNSNVSEFDGGEFYLMIDLSDSIQSINFPDTFKWKEGKELPNISANGLYIFKCIYLYTDPIAYTGEFITVVDNKDYDGIVVYGFPNPGNNYWDDPEADTTKPINKFDGVNYIDEITLTGRYDLMYYGEQCTPCLNDTDIFVTSIEVGPKGKIGKIIVDWENEVNSDIIVNGGTIDSIVGGDYETFGPSITLNSGYIGGLGVDNCGISMYNGLIDNMTFYQSVFMIHGGEVKRLTGGNDAFGWFSSSSNPQEIYNAKIGTLETSLYGGVFKCENSFFKLVTADYFDVQSSWECKNTFTFNFCEIEKISLAYVNGDCNLSNTNVIHLEVYPGQMFTISENSKIDKITIPLNLNDDYDGWGDYENFEDTETIITIKSGCIVNISTATRDNEYITLNIEDGAQVIYFDEQKEN